ncbi:MAG: peroxidase-related enzyme [Microvirga sp.]
MTAIRSKTQRAASKQAVDPEHAVSWLRLPEPPDVESNTALFERSRQNLGYVRNMQYILAQHPAVLAAQDALSRSLTVDFEGGLSGKERELIALVVSVHNRCEPCVWGHAAKLRQITGDPLWVGMIEVNYRRASLSERERALADYALKITEAPATIEPADVDRLRDAGVAEGEIIEAAAVAAYFNLSNRINSALGIHPNPQPFSANR